MSESPLQHSDDDHDDGAYDASVDGDASPHQTRKRGRASAGNAAHDGEKKPRVARPKKKGGRRRKKKDSDDDEEDEIEESEPEPYDEDDFVIHDQEPVVKDTTLYCNCRQTYNPRRPMVGCDTCNEWYHLNCVGLKKADAEAMPTYECGNCAEARATGRQIIRKPDAPTDGQDDGSIAHHGGGVGDDGTGQVGGHHVDPATQEALIEQQQQQAAVMAHQQQLAAQYPGAYQMQGAGRQMPMAYPGTAYGMQQVQQPVAAAPAPVAGQPLTFGQLSDADKEKYRRQLALRAQQMQATTLAQQQAQVQAQQQQQIMMQQQMLRQQQAAAAAAGNGLTMGGIPQGVPQPQMVPVTSAPAAAAEQMPVAAAPAPVEQVAVAPQ